MTGPEHYREAERLLAAATSREVLDFAETQDIPEEDLTAGLTVTLAAAQVRATLALAAATAEPIAKAYDGGYDTTIPRAWSEAIS